MDYLVIIEAGDEGMVCAYVPDLPGCVAMGDTEQEVRSLIEEAIEAHIQAMREQGEMVPPPISRAITIHAA